MKIRSDFFLDIVGVVLIFIVSILTVSCTATGSVVSEAESNDSLTSSRESFSELLIESHDGEDYLQAGEFDDFFDFIILTAPNPLRISFRTEEEMNESLTENPTYAED
ncbi:MAG: hypothetical protein ACLFNK_03130 [Candidatus Woesearchaeota archaeon]